jgi:hypothetical protein
MFALTPDIYYHSTILYLELPALALFTVAIYYIKPIICDDFNTVKSCPGWYALLIASLIKETFAIMMLMLIILRIAVRFSKLLINRQITFRAVLDEIAAVFCMIVPWGVYLVFRIYFANVRGYTPLKENLMNVALYHIAFKALWSQFSILLILAAGGFIIGLLKRQFVLTFSLVILFVGFFVFHFAGYPDYVGLARFNLFLFGPLSGLAIFFLVSVSKKSRTAVLIIVLMGTIINVAMSPVAIGGEKDPTWAAPALKAVERYYPHEEAFNWLKNNRPGWGVVFGGERPKVRLYWYFAKTGYRTKFFLVKRKAGVSEMESLKRTLHVARRLGFPLVLFHTTAIRNEIAEQEFSIMDYKVIKVFKNRYTALVLYQAQNINLAVKQKSFPK